MVLPNPARNTVEHMRDDHAAPLLTTDAPAYPGSRVRFVAVDPADSNNVYALFGGQGGRGAAWLTVSRDRGRNWARLRQFPGQAMRTMYFDGTLRLVSESSVFALRGGEWEETPGPQGVAIQSASGGLGLLYATSAAGIHMSEDGGKTWRTADNLLPGTPRFLNIACSTLHAQTAYVAFTEQRAGEGNVFGIAKTMDGGRRWTPVYEESRKPAANVERAWIEDFYGGTGPVRDLGVSPTDPNVCYATDNCPRSFRTLDGGKSWQQVISKHVAGDRWTTTGFDVTTCYGVHFDPFDLKNVFISYTDVGLFKSAGSGETWKSSIAGIPRRWQNTTYWIEFDPKVKGMVWGAFARTHDLPRPRMWQRQDPDNYQGGVGTSTDGGEHWVEMKLPEGVNGPTGLTLDPEDNRRMYLSAWGAQLADAGSAAVPAGCRVPGVCGGGVYLSTDSGESWRRIFDASQHVYDVTVDARNPNIVYNCGFETGAWRSTDRGATWARIRGFNFKWGHRVIPDPADAARIYITTFGGSVWHGPAAGDPRAVEDIITPVPTAP